MTNLLTFLTAYKNKKNEYDKLEKELKALKTELETYATGKYNPDKNGKIEFTCGQYAVSITPCKRTDIDRKKLEADHPDIALEYSKITEYNRTIVK